MKRVLSLVLALVLVFGTILPAFADDAVTEVAEKTAGERLNEYGLILGTGDGLDGDKPLTRAEMATILCRLYGEEAEADAYNILPSFTDVQDPEAWYTWKIAYAANKGWMKGYPDNTFLPEKELSAQEVNVLMLRVLGYGQEDAAKEWEEANAKAADLGIAVNAADPMKVQRNEIFEALVAAVDTNPKDCTKPLGAKLELPNYEYVGAVTVESVKAVTTTKVEVMFSGAVDAISADNFEIEGVVVSAANMESDMMKALLTVSPLTPNKEYKLTVKGVKVDANELPVYETMLKVGDVTALYNPTLTVDKEVIKADGASQAIVTFALKDSLGNVITNADNVEVAFSTTFGNFAQNRVNLSNGTAELLLNSEFLTADKVADLRAVVIEAQDANLIGLKADASVLMSPNPEDAAIESLGASMTNAESNQADRVIAYFNKDVKVSDYVDENGVLDPAKVELAVRKQTTKETGGFPVDVRGLLPVPGNSKALQIMLNVEVPNGGSNGNWLTDNADVFVKFVDKNGSVDVARTTTFKLTDARRPALLSIENDGLTTFVATFSEAVEDVTATELTNWAIDGILLSNVVKWGNVTATVGQFDVVNGLDKRHIVTFKLGPDKYLTAGSHSVQAANVGDWAYKTDSFNKMETQTIDFYIEPDTAVPTAKVIVHSPEQYLVEYNRDVLESAVDWKNDMTFQVYNTTTNQWETEQMDNNVLVTKIEGNKFLVETKMDWTVRHNTLGTNKNYFNYNYRLHIKKDAVTNIANGLKSAEQMLSLNDAIMTTPDTVSPIIDKIEKDTTVPGQVYNVTMSEPVKMSLTANPEGETLAQQQLKLPVVTASFIKSDYSKTVDANVVRNFVDNYDKVIEVTPNETLTAGEWILVVRSISDDIGNTAASATKKFTVEGQAAAADDFKVLWAVADVDNDFNLTEPTNIGHHPDWDTNYDYVYVKFSKAIKVSGTVSNVLATTNYTLDGSALPLGTQILANIVPVDYTAQDTVSDIVGYDELDSVIDSITIRLPQGTLENKNTPHALNISASLTSANNEPLVNAGEKILPFALAATDWLEVLDNLAARRLLNNAIDLANGNGGNGFVDQTQADAFYNAYNTAKTAIEALDNETTVDPYVSTVRAQYLDALANTLNTVANNNDEIFLRSVVVTPGQQPQNTNPDAGDVITIMFSEATNKPALTDAILTVDNGHTLDIAGDTTAVWNQAGDTLTITLGVGAVLQDGDVVAFSDTEDVKDAAGQNELHNVNVYTVVENDF